MRYKIVVNGAVVALGIASALPAGAIEISAAEYMALRFAGAA